MLTSSKDCTYATDCESLFCKTKQKTNIRGLLFLLEVLHKPRGAWFHFSYFKVLHSELSLSCLVTSFCFALFPFSPWALFPFPLDPAPHQSSWRRCTFFSSLSASMHGQSWTFPTLGLTSTSIYWLGMDRLGIIFKALIPSNLTPPLFSFRSCVQDFHLHLQIMTHVFPLLSTPWSQLLSLLVYTSAMASPDSLLSLAATQSMYKHWQPLWTCNRTSLLQTHLKAYQLLPTAFRIKE